MTAIMEWSVQATGRRWEEVALLGKFTAEFHQNLALACN